MQQRAINGTQAPSAAKKRNRTYFNKGIEIKMTKDQYYDWCDKQSNTIMGLYKENKTPSIDRINSDGHYELTNIQILEWTLNRQMGAINQKTTPLWAQNIKTGELIHAMSWKEMQKLTGVSTGNIWACIKKKRRTAGGYIFFNTDPTANLKTPCPNCGFCQFTLP